MHVLYDELYGGAEYRGWTAEVEVSGSIHVTPSSYLPLDLQG